MTNLLKSALFLLLAFSQSLSAQTMSDGMAAMQMEEWDNAIKIYSELSKTNDAKALLALGNAYVAKNDKANAKATFDKVLATGAENAYGLIANGRVFLLDNRSADADKQFEKAAKQGKKDIDALRAIGESYLYGPARNLVRAEEKLKKAYEFKTKDFATLLALGYAYKEMPKGGDATLHYEFAQAVEPKNPLAYFMQAKVYKQAKLPEQYVKYLEKTLEVDPGFTPALRALSEYWYFTKKNYAKALDAYDRLIKNGRGATIDDRMQLANCLFLNKKYKECSDLVEQIIKEDGSKNYLRRLLGYCYFENGEHQKAHDILKDYFLKVTPEKVLSTDHYYYGDAIVKTKGDTATAIDNYRKGMKIDSTWEKNREIGALYFAQKKYCLAAGAYQIYLDSVPKPEPMDFYRLGSCYYSCREDSMRFYKSLAAFVKVTELAPTAGIGWFWAGKSATKLDPDIVANPGLHPEFGKAAPYFTKYIEIGGVDPVKNKKDLISAYEYMLYMHYAKGNVADYQTYSTKLLEIDPENPTGKGFLEEFNRNGGTITPAPPSTPTAPATPTPPGNGNKN